MLKKDIIDIISKHWNKIKFFLLILAVIAMIVAVRTYINYNTIIEAINKVNHNIENLKEEIAYSQNFLEPYLESEYADYFLAHKNNILFNWEFIIRFQSPQTITDDEDQEIEDKIIQTPQQSRKHFIRSKLK